MKRAWQNRPKKKRCFFGEFATGKIGFIPERYAKLYELLGNQTGIENRGVIFERMGRECSIHRVIGTALRREMSLQDCIGQLAQLD